VKKSSQKGAISWDSTAKTQRRKEDPAFGFFLHPSSFRLFLPAPFPLQNVKEQAPERRTRFMLPLFRGNATKSFLHRRIRGTHRSGGGKQFPPVPFPQKWPPRGAKVANEKKERQDEPAWARASAFAKATADKSAGQAGLTG
jgi:hypothetical protein